jgi:hypothetical protein
MGLVCPQATQYASPGGSSVWQILQMLNVLLRRLASAAATASAITGGPVASVRSRAILTPGSGAGADASSPRARRSPQVLQKLCDSGTSAPQDRQVDIFIEKILVDWLYRDFHVLAKNGPRAATSTNGVAGGATGARADDGRRATHGMQRAKKTGENPALPRP